ncbi:DNA cytosine methyltransferase [Streptomyces vinaceus]|uniref:DNA cytosine methyltransferase n=1 Tax=Streptomyces vinaceus TaxID=1960 RepID=UPI00367ACC8E
MRVMDLFAGCGGFAEGFRSFSAGTDEGAPPFNTVAALEFDTRALATFKANHRQAVPLPVDIRDFDAKSFAGSIDVIAGGPPCQGFSGLGKGKGDDPRNALWQHYVRVVSEVVPQVFVMENVNRFMKSYEHDRLLEALQPDGPLADYTLTKGVLNAADYGVPQVRRRAIVIGTHRSVGCSIALPKATHAQNPLECDPLDLLAAELPRVRWRTVDGVFERSARLAHRVADLPHRSDAYGVPGPFRTDELHIGRKPTPLSVARYQAIPMGGNRLNLQGRTAVFDGCELHLSTESWDRHNSGAGDVMGRLRLGLPSVTIRTEFFKPEKGRYLHPVEHRPITHYEAALLQGFPEEYLWHGTKGEIARQIGNAVPIGLARAIAGTIHAQLRR